MILKKNSHRTLLITVLCPHSVFWKERQRFSRNAPRDKHWGETPCAFVGLKEGSRVSEQDLIEFCRDHLAGFKIPKTVIFQELPKTSTGKIRKNVLREQVRNW